MRQGWVYKRCRVCARAVDARRCSCGSDNLSWAFRVDVGPRGAARDVKVRSGFATKADAVAAMAEIQRAAADPTHVEPTKLTVGQWLDQWLPSMKGRIRGASWVSYETAVRRHLKPRIGRVPLGSLTRAQVRAAYEGLEASGLSTKTVHNVHVCLRRALRDAVDDRLVRDNAADRAHTLPRGRRVEMRTWDLDEVRAFLAHVDGDELAAMWRVFATTGMRRGEVLGLRWQDVDLDGAFLKVSRARVRGLDGWTIGEPKTAAGRRRVNLDPVTVTALRLHKARQVVVAIDGPIFARADGSPVDPDVASQSFGSLARAAGLPRIRLHDLRHTWATLALAQGVNAKVVQERLGHSSITVTLDLYSHVAPTMDRDAAALVATAIDG